MDITPEQRKAIYEAEKSRIEQEAGSNGGQASSSQNTSTGLAPNVAALLCYLGVWVTGIIFLILEQKSVKVRFHATQSILIFAPLAIMGWILGWIPNSGGVLSAAVSIVALVLWITLMVKAYRDEEFEVPFVSSLSRQLIKAPVAYPSADKTQAADNISAPSGEVPARRYVPGSRTGRLVGSSLSIGWSAVLLVLFNYYSEYIATYQGQTADGVTNWVRDPILSQDLHLWLPVLNTALFAAILGNIITIVWDKYLLREPIKILIDVFALVAIVSLINIFPFDFSAFSDTVALEATEIAVKVFLILVAVGIGVGILVRFIRLIANIARGITSYR
ncbi:putative membrane protein [Dehalogenimonas alkenigignens]|uniref:Putative membrane protein n=1 Tax=Dehalogenimonas alkenigignens TaxID=1217799 RepID=A0A0W0GKJ6_9CHLR|nr:hypothetical protein [Dehalogenimonas alkenigignens]KTB49058.1 putative membrane protein [Dehalogenimonas alkenigignens]